MKSFPKDLTQIIEQAKHSVELIDDSNANPAQYHDSNNIELQQRQLAGAQHHLDMIEQSLTNALNAIERHDDLEAEAAIAEALKHVNIDLAKPQVLNKEALNKVLCEPMLAG
ncbi:hypothetical protein A3K86_21825 [Photobacterium jeanii]|uniref:Uncharacterized protein n=1 Tax=Photobacterium jeanii TaxID=858640 RepID=A0A178K3P0_9GAMM|nr:hypothetical protein [Photobacterium jeanii]OAN11565.1 hypothetical protein A3K86_21825 [Photobacterium jeanii]PST91087.1 hypothetical protein C9I91_10930 [Photobacterium jeanii]